MQAAGLEVAVAEAEDVVGGRVRTDVVDGMLLDRGFQVHNTGYPEAQRVLDHDTLGLRRFTAGALVRVGDRLHRVGDPRTVPTEWLTGKHTIFGEVTSGMDVVNAMGKVETTKGNNKPVKDIVMKAVYLKGARKAAEEPKK